MSHFYPFHIQDQATKYCSYLTVQTLPHSAYPKTNLTTTHKLHKANRAMRSFMQFNIEGNTKVTESYSLGASISRPCILIQWLPKTVGVK